MDDGGEGPKALLAKIRMWYVQKGIRPVMRAWGRLADTVMLGSVPCHTSGEKRDKKIYIYCYIIIRGKKAEMQHYISKILVNLTLLNVTPIVILTGNVWSLDSTFLSSKTSGLKLKLIRICMRRNNLFIRLQCTSVLGDYNACAVIGI